MKRKNIMIFLILAIFSTSLIIATVTSREMAHRGSTNGLFRQESQDEQPKVLPDKNQENSDRSDAILDLLVDDDDLERQQQELAEIWLSYLDEYKRTNQSAERISLEEEQKRIMLARDQGEAIEGAITVLPAGVPEDYTGHYLGHEKFTIVLSSFDNLAFYQSLFDDLALVDFNLVEHSYSDLFAASQQLMEAIPNATASVNSVLGRITLQVDIKIDANNREWIFESAGIDSKLYDYIDIEEVELILLGR